MSIDPILTPQGYEVPSILAPQAVVNLPFSDATPMPESKTGTPGVQAVAVRAGHEHPRLTSATTGHVLDAAGEATITFTRTFVGKPAVTYMLDEPADAGPLMIKVKTWITNGAGEYIGCVVKGYRFQLLPASLTLVTALASFSVYAGPTTGAPFTFIALQRS